MDRLTGLFLTLTLLCIAGCQSPEPAGQNHIQTEFERVPEAVKPLPVGVGRQALAGASVPLAVVAALVDPGSVDP